MTRPRFDMELVVGSILLVGVLSSMALLAAGLAWHWATSGNTVLDYSLAGTTVFQFVLTDIGQLTSGALRPRVLVNLGIGVLLLTPYVRVLASLLYFALVERNPKYSAFTAFVLLVLTYSLFLR
jgi:uncharacterized membrane protein